ncbi:MAG TPA: hypothetical protein VFH91_04595 [Pyrinomonadaceae bacterium]|nr:hypothetical protein [Pyrinomonadaceae bacterium]
MNPRRFLKPVTLAAFLVLIAISGVNVCAQTTTAQPDNKDSEVNLDTQMYLIVGTNQQVEDPRLPSSLDSVIKQLRVTLPFKNYRLAATLINRVQNESRFELSWIGGPLANSTANMPSTPSFSQFKVRNVKLVRNSEGQQMVQMNGFNFGARIPIQTGAAVASNAVAPVFNYENTGLQTDISMREGEPVIVGTLNVGPSGDAIILVVSAKRTQR